MMGRKTTGTRMVRAFTLIELMMVVSIIGVLASIALPTFNTLVCRSRQSEARTILAAIYKAEAAYQSEHDTYVAGDLETLTLLGLSVDGPRSQYVYSVITDDTVRSVSFTSVASGVSYMTGDLLEGGSNNQIVMANDACAAR